MSNLSPFHLAIPVDNVEKARAFYRDILQCEEGRSDKLWVDFNFYGHQLVIHYKENDRINPIHHNPVDGHDVPIPHFGVVLAMDDWNKLAERLKTKSVDFIIEPYTRFKGEAGEQATMFFLDPCGNALEFKAFNNIKNLFAK